MIIRSSIYSHISNFGKFIFEKISTGNCKVYENELSSELYQSYLELRQKVYQFHSKEKDKK